MAVINAGKLNLFIYLKKDWQINNIKTKNYEESKYINVLTFY